MSNLIVVDEAKVNLTKQVCIPSQNFNPNTMKLFQNNYTPFHGSVIGDFDEATYSGYNAYLMGSPAVSSSLDASGRAVCTWSPNTWTKSGPFGSTIYGYYVVDGSGNLCFAEKFDAAIAMTTDGAFVTLTPKFTGMSQYSNT